MVFKSNMDAKDGWLSFESSFSAKDLMCISKNDQIKELSITKHPPLTVKVASRFSAFQSVQWLWLWCSVNRTAMRHVISIPGLETLDILAMQHPGSLKNFKQATTLKTFRCNHYMTEMDLLEISMLPVLQELGAQNSAITQRSLEALLRMPKLEHLDLEATKLDDKMASILAESIFINHLDVGATRITSKGLKKICEMSQLRSLDIWAIDIVESDLDFLTKLSNLEYLSIGGYYDQSILTSKGVLSRLKEIPSLKRIWLDGITLTEVEKKSLEERYEHVQN